MKCAAVFSVVIPNYNRVESLVRAVNSALVQGCFVREVIVVDDCSDNIDEIEEALMSIGDDKVVLVKNNKKSNAAKTRNQGQGWQVLPGCHFLTLMMCSWKESLLQSKKTLMLVQLWMLFSIIGREFFFNDKIEREVPSRRLSDGEHIADYLFVDGEIMQTSTLTIPKDFFSRGGFNESYPRHQDYDICLSLYHQGYSFLLVDFPGTAIYWTSQARPADKGESISYSRNWAIENRSRMTKQAFNGFCFYFVAIKAARCGRKREAVRALGSLEGASGVSLKRAMVYLSILFIPSLFMRRAYLLYKSFSVERKRL